MPTTAVIESWTADLVSGALTTKATSGTAAASTRVRELADDVIGRDAITDPVDADLGILDGYNGSLRGDRFDPTRIGLAADASLAEYALVLIGDTIGAEDRARLRRHAVVSCLTDTGRHGLLRAASHWWIALRGAVDATPEADRTRFAASEVDTAVTAIFRLGAMPPAKARAKVWQNGQTTDPRDLRQAAYLGMMSALANYNPSLAPLSSHAHYRMIDSVRDEVWGTEHPHLTRNAFKNKALIIKTAERVEAETGLHPHDESLHDIVASRIEGLTSATVAQVLLPTSTVSLNASAKGEDGEGDEYLDMQEDHRPGPVDTVEHLETVRTVAQIARTHLSDDLRDILLRHQGMDGHAPEDLSSIGKSHGKSRTWAGGQRNKALSIMRHPTLLREILGGETSPEALTDGKPLLDPTSRLTERQRFVARHVLGIGGAPQPGSPEQQCTVVARLMDISAPEVRWIAMTVRMVMTGRTPATDMMYSPARTAAKGAYDRVRKMADLARTTGAEQTAKATAAERAAATAVGTDRDRLLAESRHASNAAHMAHIATQECETAADTLVDILETLQDWADGTPTQYKVERSRLVNDPVAIMEAAFDVAVTAKAASSLLRRTVDADPHAATALIESIRPTAIPTAPARRRKAAAAPAPTKPTKATKPKRTKKATPKADDKGCTIIENGVACDMPHDAKGWCKVHYSRWYYTGDPLGSESNRANCETAGCEGKWMKGGKCETHWKLAKAQREAKKAARAAKAS